MKTTKGRKECKDKMVMEPEQMEEDRKGMVETKCASLCMCTEAHAGMWTCEHTECASVWVCKHMHVQMCMSVRVSGIEHTCKLAHVRRLVMGASW